MGEGEEFETDLDSVLELGLGGGEDGVVLFEHTPVDGLAHRVSHHEHLRHQRVSGAEGHVLHRRHTLLTQRQQEAETVTATHTVTITSARGQNTTE